MRSTWVLLAGAVFALPGCDHGRTITRSPAPAISRQDGSDTNRSAQTAPATQPDADAMVLYRQAQALMKAGKREEGYAVAQKAMKQFVAENRRLAWMLLESIDLDDRRVDVHFNMGPEERDPPDIGIVKPLSFRVWAKGEDRALMEIIDFEIGLFDGKPSTAALGQSRGAIHATLELLPLDASYETVRKAVIARLSKDGKP